MLIVRPDDTLRIVLALRLISYIYEIGGCYKRTYEKREDLYDDAVRNFR